MGVKGLKILMNSNEVNIDVEIVWLDHTRSNDSLLQRAGFFVVSVT